jgi:hypothetical protein
MRTVSASSYRRWHFAPNCYWRGADRSASEQQGKGGDGMSPTNWTVPQFVVLNKVERSSSLKMETERVHFAVLRVSRWTARQPRASNFK